jgi:hypothetical protein
LIPNEDDVLGDLKKKREKVIFSEVYLQKKGKGDILGDLKKKGKR